MNDKTKNTETDDTEGQGLKYSDATIKHDVIPVGPTTDTDKTDETDDTEGNAIKIKGEKV